MINPATLAPASSVAEVIQRMENLDAQLPAADGLKWFNFLYLSVTKAVQQQLAAGALFFADQAWIDRLDVAFANYYFKAVLDAEGAGPASAAAAWRPLLSNRTTAKIARIQFALAGMNAHINRDLVYTLLDLYSADGAAPSDGSARHQDFTRVNQLLKQVEAQVRGTLLVGTPLANGGAYAPLEDVIAMWSVTNAREAAWDHSQSFWHLRNLPVLQRASLDSLDGLTELASNGLLIRILP